jgi:hypothetical protein
LTTDREARTSRTVARAPQNDHRRSLDPFAPLEQRLELGAGGETFGTAEPSAYTASRLRPFARRRFNVLRPPGVLIRSRKP